MDMDVENAIRAALEAARHPRCLQGWPATPAEAEADRLLREEAARLGLPADGRADAVAHDVRQRLAIARLDAIAAEGLRLAAAALESARGRLTAGRVDEAVACLDLARHGRHLHTWARSDQLEAARAKAAALGIRPVDRLPSVEAVDRALSQIAEAVFVRGGREALRYIPGLPAVLHDRGSGNVCTIRLTRSGRIVRAYCRTARRLEPGTPGLLIHDTAGPMPRFSPGAGPKEGAA